jgi:hypothetical protein
MPAHTRRTFLLTAASALHAAAPASLATPHKYGKLVLEASTDPAAFDRKTVDCPFVFHYQGQFYTT